MELQDVYDLEKEMEKIQGHFTMNSGRNPNEFGIRIRQMRTGSRPELEKAAKKRTQYLEEAENGRRKRRKEMEHEMASQLSAQKRVMDLAKLKHSVAAEILPASVKLPNNGLRNSTDAIPSEVERDPVDFHTIPSEVERDPGDSPISKMNDFEKSTEIRYNGRQDATDTPSFSPSELGGDVKLEDNQSR